MKLYLHPSVQDIVSRPLSHATLLTGQYGVGLYTVAEEMAKKYEQLPMVKPELLTKTSTTPQIGIDAIRSLYGLTRGKSSKGTVVVIDDADLMTLPAQHSFLKLLEEPNESVHFILTSHHPEALLATVRSRVQTLHIPNVSDDMTAAIIETFSDISPTKHRQLVFAAKGLPAELSRLAHDKAYFEKTSELMVQAKSLIQGTPYEKLVVISKVKSQRLEALALIEKTMHILASQPTARNITQTKLLLKAHEQISAGGNIRLQLAANML